MRIEIERCHSARFKGFDLVVNKTSLSEILIEVIHMGHSSGMISLSSPRWAFQKGVTPLLIILSLVGLLFKAYILGGSDLS